VKQNFLRAETLTIANAALVSAQNAVPLARSWGGGEVAAADGLRFVVPVRTIHSGPNPRYFGRERGVTWYNLASGQFTGLNAVIVPGTRRDSLYLLAVVLEQETELQPTEIMTDTAGYTDTIFGEKADYGMLDALASNKIKVKLIAEHWDDLLRLAGSLKLGVVCAAGLTRTLQTNDHPTRLARALQELGRLVKTLYLLRFIDDEGYRRRILIQLNRGEGRHQLARVIFHGRRGELRQRYREGQEDQLGALGLVVNLVVLWNTISMDAALNQLVAEGYEVRPEAAHRLSPLGLKHINMLGRYTFTLPNWSREVSSGRCATRGQSVSTRRENELVWVFRSVATQTPINPAPPCTAVPGAPATGLGTRSRLRPRTSMSASRPRRRPCTSWS
jgi:TnpA family transposase